MCDVRLGVLLIRRPPGAALFPYTTLFRSWGCGWGYEPNAGFTPTRSGTTGSSRSRHLLGFGSCTLPKICGDRRGESIPNPGHPRSEEHTSELQSRENLVCRLLLEKKKKSH